MYVPRSGVEVEEEVHPIGEPGQHWTVGLIEPGLGEAWIGGRIQQTACRGQDTAGSRYRNGIHLSAGWGRIQLAAGRRQDTASIR